ncbi:hypothetical protein K0G60_22550 [Bacteroides fragilis]|nr:hypothetical protein [Bacteroides fragilis]
MSYSPKYPSLLNGWHSLTDGRLFGELGSLSMADGQARLHATTGRVSVPESGQIFSGCTLLTCSFRVDMSQCARSRTGNKDVFGRLRTFSPASCVVYASPRFLSFMSFLYPLCSSGLHLTVCGISFEQHVTVRGIAARFGLSPRLPMSEPFRGASIGFVSHKTAGCAGEQPGTPAGRLSV